MKPIYCLLVWLCPYLNGLAQPPIPVIKPLAVGDTLPAITITANINGPVSIHPISKHQGQLIILDFFATTCGSCIHFLPHLDSLQRSMGDSLQVMVVTAQSTELIRGLVQRNTIVRSVKLPFVTNDTLLGQLFPYRFLPHEVWVKDGIVLAITSPQAITAANIRKALSGKGFTAPSKMDNLVFNRELPLADNMKGVAAVPVLFGSLFTNAMAGVGSYKGSTSNANSIRRYFINRPLLNLYQYAYGFAANRLVLEVADTTVFSYANDSLHTYCYEITTAIGIPEKQVKAWMAVDLDRQGQVRGNVEKRMMPCYIITNTGNSDLWRTKGGKNNLQKDANGNLVFTNFPFTQVVEQCNYSFNPTAYKPIVLDETGIIGSVNLTIPGAALKDAALLANALAPYGLLVTKTTRQLDVFVLKDRP